MVVFEQDRLGRHVLVVRFSISSGLIWFKEHGMELGIHRGGWARTGTLSPPC
ncbi:hypothetical protein HanRHA438_Chr12g0547171 [Helianthus annuus]|nr:hypothetical protein HanRHA438_Chr12g0547171 [Helianthus annuus]